MLLSTFDFRLLIETTSEQQTINDQPNETCYKVNVAIDGSF